MRVPSSLALLTSACDYLGDRSDKNLSSGSLSVGPTTAADVIVRFS